MAMGMEVLLLDENQIEHRSMNAGLSYTLCLSLYVSRYDVELNVWITTQVRLHPFHSLDGALVFNSSLD